MNETLNCGVGMSGLIFIKINSIVSQSHVLFQHPHPQIVVGFYQNCNSVSQSVLVNVFL